MEINAQYADANGTGVSDKWGSWHALKEFSTGFQERLEYSSIEEAVNQKKDWTGALSQSNYTVKRESDGKTLSAADVFKMLAETIREEHKITSRDIEKQQDWREMDEDEWSNLLEHIDKCIEDFKERLKELEEKTEEAARKAGAQAPADQRATAISNAIMSTINNGIVGGGTFSEEKEQEELNWTYKLKTDNQTILETAQKADKTARNAISKTQEMALTGETTAGIFSAENIRESAFSEEDEEDKIWTITCYTDEGIICKQGRKGELEEIWRIDYKNVNDAQKVWDFLDKFNPETDLKFCGDKAFWEKFLMY